MSEPPGRDQDEAVDSARVLVGELKGDAAAQRVPNERRRAVAEFVEEVPDGVCMRADGVVAAELVRVAVAHQVRRQNGVPPRQLGQHPVPGGRA